jgi:hypothetical protein
VELRTEGEDTVIWSHFLGKLLPGDAGEMAPTMYAYEVWRTIFKCFSKTIWRPPLSLSSCIVMKTYIENCYFTACFSKFAWFVHKDQSPNFERWTYNDSSFSSVEIFFWLKIKWKHFWDTGLTTKIINVRKFVEHQTEPKKSSTYC